MNGTATSHTDGETATSFASFVLDATGKVDRWSASAERMTGWTSRIIGTSFEVFYSAADQAASVPGTILAHARVSADDFRQRTAFVRKDGSSFPAETTLVALFDEHGRLRGFNYLLRHIGADEDERKHTERTARIGQMVVEVAHDLNNVLQTVGSNATLLQENSGNAPLV